MNNQLQLFSWTVFCFGLCVCCFSSVSQLKPSLYLCPFCSLFPWCGRVWTSDNTKWIAMGFNEIQAKLREVASLEGHVLLKKLRDALESLRGRLAGRNKEDVEKAISMVSSYFFLCLFYLLKKKQLFRIRIGALCDLSWRFNLDIIDKVFWFNLFLCFCMMYMVDIYGACTSILFDWYNNCLFIIKILASNT